MSSVYLRLGRVSNLPTVWTNVLAGAVLGGGALTVKALVPTMISMSLFYVGGMYLNDAFDREIDARERPERPIPSGEISAAKVFGLGFGMMAVGLVMLAGLIAVGASPAVVATGLLLGGSIVLYDAWHKQNPISPILMGICRVLVYFNAALATGGHLPWIGGLMLLCYLIGLTYVAKQENLAEVKNLWPLAFLAIPLVHGTLFSIALLAWIVRAIQILRVRVKGNIPRAVGALIAGISLVDAVHCAASGMSLVALACLTTVPVTLMLQRWVAGT